MEADMVCQAIVGGLEITAGEQQFVAKEGDVWSCGKGSTKEAAANKGSEVAVMRVIMLESLMNWRTASRCHKTRPQMSFLRRSARAVCAGARRDGDVSLGMKRRDMHVARDCARRAY